MSKRIVLWVLLFGIICLMSPVYPSATVQERESLKEETNVDSSRTVRIYCIDTKDAGNVLEDTWIPAEYQKYCWKIGQQYNLNPYLLIAMIEAESSGNAAAINGDGDSGLMQINRKWHEERIEKLGVKELTDPYSNILVAADYFSELLEENDHNMPLALMKYNMDHEQAEILMDQGICSKYAEKVIARMWELQLLHRKEDVE